MKYTIIAILFLAAGCIDDPAPTPAPTPVKWIDVTTRKDTIITNAQNNSSILYYAIKNWQSFPDSNFAQGYRQIVGANKDSVVVVIPGTSATKYYGPFNISINATQDTLKSQNFLDTVHVTPTRLFIEVK